VPLVALLLGGLFIVLAAAALGWWAWIVAGVLILIGIALGVRVLSGRLLGVDDVPKLPSRRDSTTYRVLVVVDDRLPPEALQRVIEDHADGRPATAFVVAPAESSRLDRITGDEAAYERANESLETTLNSLEGLTASQNGKVGSHDPLQAIDEALREFPAEEILVPAHSDWTRAAESKFGVHVVAVTAGS